MVEKPGLLDWLIAPLTWFERASGWKRLGLLGLYAMTLLVVGVLGWRAFCLWSLPDIGEPFDLARYGTVEVAERDNAMVLYAEASKQLISPSTYEVINSRAWDIHSWALAEPEVRRWVVDNRPALATWLRGTERPDSLLVQPRNMKFDTSLGSLFALMQFETLAILEATALEEAGDLEGAWRLYRAVLRASRHAGMHGGTSHRYLGLSLLTRIGPDVRRWAEDPRVAPAMLRRAVADLEECRRMTPPMSEMVRCDYFTVRSNLEWAEAWGKLHHRGPEDDRRWLVDAPIVYKARDFLNREPERSLRVLNLVVAGELAQCDRPFPDRPGLISKQYPIYAIDPRTPPAVAAIEPEALESWADRSMFSALWNASGGSMSRIASDPGILDSLLLQMAERAFEAEHGRPAKAYGELVGPYLKALPEGIGADDLISGEPAPN